MEITGILFSICLILFGLAMLYVSFSHPDSSFGVNHGGSLDSVLLGIGSLLIGSMQFLMVLPKQIVIAGTLLLIGMVLIRRCCHANAEEQKLDASEMNWLISLISGIVLILLALCNIINYIF
ncbi:MAG: hypothetical protein IJ642_04225 [Oscillospiraceae bacterium]|nr:hypothetical protein [Oscillospiraceae bacterium]